MLREDQVSVIVLHQKPDHFIHVVVAIVGEDFGVILARLACDDVAEMHLADAVAACQPVAHRHRVFTQFAGDAAVPGHAVGWRIHRLHQALPVGEAVEDLGRAAAHRRRRIVGMHGKNDMVLLGHRNDRLEEVCDVLPGILVTLGGLARQRRQSLHPGVIEFVIDGAATAGNALVPVDRAVIVEVPLHHRDAQFAAIDDGLLDLFDLGITAGTAADDLVHVRIHAALVGPADHHDADMHGVLLQRVDARLQIVHAPGLGRHVLKVDPVDADLLDADRLLFAQGVVHVNGELGRVGALLRHAQARGGMRIVGRIRSLLREGGHGRARKKRAGQFVDHRPACGRHAVSPLFMILSYARRLRERQTLMLRQAEVHSL